MCWGNTKNKIVFLMMVLTVVLLFVMNGVHAQEKPTVNGITVEQVGDGEWRIINQDGEFVGTLKSEKQQSFTFYDAGGVFMGTILESKDWIHRLYRKRDTRVTPEEARLYIDALKAIEIINK